MRCIDVSSVLRRNGLLGEIERMKILNNEPQVIEIPISYISGTAFYSCCVMPSTNYEDYMQHVRVTCLNDYAEIKKTTTQGEILEFSYSSPSFGSSTGYEQYFEEYEDLIIKSLDFAFLKVEIISECGHDVYAEYKGTARTFFNKQGKYTPFLLKELEIYVG
jgi:hypothetical protein